MKKKDEIKVCLVGSSGGHLTHLYMLKPFWKDKNRFWVTFDKEDARSLLEGEKVYPCYFPTNRSIKALIKNTKIAWDVLHKEKPDLIISCGAAVAVPFFYIGKMMGAKLVYIEVFDRIDKPTMTGKMVYGDQIIYNPEILAPEFERSGYNSVWTDEETDEWLQTVENGIVTACSRTGGKGGWQLYSISRWTAEDGKRLKHHLEIEFEQKQNRQIYWDDVAMFCYPEEYQLGVRPMNKDDIIEVDNLSELIALDASYKKYEEGK